MPHHSLTRADVSLGGSWVCIDHRGYKDAFIVALTDVYDEPITGAAMEPRLMFIGDGAGLSCKEITPYRA